MHDIQSHINEIIGKGFNWPFVLAGIGMGAGTVTWAVKKVFPTRGDMDECKREIMHSMELHEIREEKKYDQLTARFEHQSDAIWNDIKWIKGYLIEHGPPSR